jgi:hypothetical protein
VSGGSTWLAWTSECPTTTGYVTHLLYSADGSVSPEVLRDVAESLPVNSPAPTPTPTVEEVLDQARAAMGGAQSYRFSIDMESESDGRLQKAVVSGEWAGPDRLRVKIEEVGSDEGHVNEVIVIGERTFVRDSDYTDGAWQEQQPEAMGRVGIFDVPDDLTGLQMLEDETIHGGVAFHIRGIQDILPITGTPIKGTEQGRFTMVYDLFISKSDYRPLRVMIDANMVIPLPAGADGSSGEEIGRNTNSRYVADFFDYNELVNIEPPESVVPWE